MEFDWDLISAKYYERIRAQHEPLAQAVRRLIDASIHTVLGEWQPGGRHLNLGSGPPPELEAFLAVLPQ